LKNGEVKINDKKCKQKTRFFILVLGS
jgi:hypothetical protein